MVRLKDIASRAGVSVMTVSKVMRDAADISPATKARVKMLAEEMGYVPDSLAQGLRTKNHPNDRPGDPERDEPDVRARDCGD